nr:hypothetical protein Iba_chr01fCG6370 [Ipomoea batatas]
MPRRTAMELRIDPSVLRIVGFERAIEMGASKGERGVTINELNTVTYSLLNPHDATAGSPERRVFLCRQLRRRHRKPNVCIPESKFRHALRRLFWRSR